MIRTAIKTALYRSGILAAYHRCRNRRHLTVAMFHRVLPPDRLREADTDPEWSVSEGFFEDCLRFFRRHYHVIGAGALIDGMQGRIKLPARPLLITFDDGWADTGDHAAPILQRLQMPAVAFIVAGALGRELWQDTLRRLWRQGVLKPEHCAGALTVEGAVETGGTSPLDGLIERLSRCTPEARNGALCRILRALGKNERAEMLSPAQMRLLHAAGCAIGSHGLTHTSLTLACDPWQELRDSRTALAASLGSEPVTLSFPNGRYNSDLVCMAWAAGYTCVFTSDPHLNRVPRRPASSLLLGRIHIPAATLSDQRGRLRPELLAAHLFLRPAVEAGCSR